MNRKGFTLVELLGVITVIVILAFLITPVVMNVMEQAKNSLNESQKNLIISYAKLWQTEHDYEISDIENSVYNLYVDEIKKGGYVQNNDIINIISSENLVNACVKITTKEYKYDYEFVEDCGVRITESE